MLKKKTLKTIGFFCGLAIIIIAYAFFIEPKIIKVEDQKIKLDCLKGNERDIKAVQLSDLHFNSKISDNWINRVSDSVSELKPEYIFLTGDLIDNKDGMPKVTSLLQKLVKISPVYVIFGNWDYKVLNYNVKSFKKEMENIGAIVLINQSQSVKMGDKIIEIIGIDQYADGDMGRNFKNAYNNGDYSGNECKIILAHSPDTVKFTTERYIDLVLAGHTHGGQVYIPIISKMILPVDYDAREYMGGFYRKDRTQIYVNRGLGESTLPIRFMAPPEITLITLQK